MAVMALAIAWLAPNLNCHRIHHDHAHWDCLLPLPEPFRQAMTTHMHEAKILGPADDEQQLTVAALKLSPNGMPLEIMLKNTLTSAQHNQRYIDAVREAIIAADDSIGANDPPLILDHHAVDAIKEMTVAAIITYSIAPTHAEGTHVEVINLQAGASHRAALTALTEVPIRCAGVMYHFGEVTAVRQRAATLVQPPGEAVTIAPGPRMAAMGGPDAHNVSRMSAKLQDKQPDNMLRMIDQLLGQMEDLKVVQVGGERPKLVCTRIVLKEEVRGDTRTRNGEVLLSVRGLDDIPWLHYFRGTLDCVRTGLDGSTYTEKVRLHKGAYNAPPPSQAVMTDTRS